MIGVAFMSYIIRRKIKNSIYLIAVTSYRDKNGKPRNHQRSLGRLDDDGVLISSKHKLPAVITEVKTVTKKFIVKPKKLNTSPNAKAKCNEAVESKISQHECKQGYYDGAQHKIYFACTHHADFIRHVKNMNTNITFPRTQERHGPAPRIFKNMQQASHKPESCARPYISMRLSAINKFRKIRHNPSRTLEAYIRKQCPRNKPVRISPVITIPPLAENYIL